MVTRLSETRFPRLHPIAQFFLSPRRCIVPVRYTSIDRHLEGCIGTDAIRRVWLGHVHPEWPPAQPANAIRPGGVADVGANHGHRVPAPAAVAHRAL